jgi:hypothetical protein
VAVSSEAVAEHKPRVEALAWRLRGLGGAEFDDLVQEGLIKVWLLLEESEEFGYIPGNLPIERAMLDWVRVCRRKGFSGYEEAETEL